MRRMKRIRNIGKDNTTKYLKTRKIVIYLARINKLQAPIVTISKKKVKLKAKVIIINKL